MTVIADALLALLIIGFFISFLLAFSMGANDVANAFGTSYGSRVLNFVQVCILASIFETLGSVLLGARVSDTISRGIANMDLYKETPHQLMYGYLSALVGASGWLLIATIFKLPVSGTHSIVGAVIGFTMVVHGPEGVKWMTLVKVVSSWFTSPLLSGAISSIIFVVVKYLVLNRPDPLKAGEKLLPILYGLTFAVISFMVINEAVSHANSKDDLPIWAVVLISIGLGILCWLVTFLVLMPLILKKIRQRLDQVNNTNSQPSVGLKKRSTFHKALKRVGQSAVFKSITSLNTFAEPDPEPSSKSKKRSAANEPTIFTIKAYNNHVCYNSLENVPPQDDEDEEQETTFSVFPSPGSGDVEQAASNRNEKVETPEIRFLFSFIQVVTATFASFSHGANDVSNAVGPLIGMFQINEFGTMIQGQKPQWWLLLFGGLSMSIGLWSLGKRVMLTIGDELTTISPANGFAMELGAAMTVLIASHLGVPISTTHCLVGSVICVSLVRDRRGVDWRIVRNIGFSWIVTVPAAALISAGTMAALNAIFVTARTFN